MKGVHLTWEQRGGYLHTLLQLVHEGLCRALGNVTAPLCADTSRMLIDMLTFRYTQLRWNTNVHAEETLAMYVGSFRRAVGKK